MGPFEFGNTTVRSGARLRDGLAAIQSSGKQGHLRGREGDLALIEMLSANEVIEERGDDTYSVGRKWRAALCKMGFLYDKYSSDQEVIGPVDHITPNGLRLINADSLAAQQECYLRAIASMQLYFDGRSYSVGTGFSPFKHIVNVLLALEQEIGSSEISFNEFASFAQFEPGKPSYADIALEIKKIRDERKNSLNKKSFDREILESSVAIHGRVVASSYIDYADENIRYLKTTGCFTSVGKGIALSPAKKSFVVELIRELPEQTPILQYWKNITEGITLPTDSPSIALTSYETLKNEAAKRGIPFQKEVPTGDVKALNNARYDLEELIALNSELDFAHLQAQKSKEILNYIAALLPKNLKPSGFISHDDIEIPRGENPAYLEWAIWRAFLAINKIKNPPFESRKFKIDRDFLPISHAPGRGPDLIFEFEDYLLVVEVTLLTTDRQATAEQVGVRRHVYEIAKSSPEKPVYCLFLAPSIRNETARDFKKASYEEDDGSELNLTIVPLPLEIFMTVFAKMFDTNNPDSDLFMKVIQKCADLASKSNTTRDWMNSIEEAFLSSI